MSTQIILFPMSPNPTVERGLYSPTKQPRALDLGDVGKEVEKLKKFIRIQKTRIPMFRCSVINCQKIGLKSKAPQVVVILYRTFENIFNCTFLFINIFCLKRNRLSQAATFCKSSKHHHIIILMLVFWGRAQNTEFVKFCRLSKVDKMLV